MNQFMPILVTLGDVDLVLNLLNAAASTQKFDERQPNSRYSQPKETHITMEGLGPL